MQSFARKHTGPSGLGHGFGGHCGGHLDIQDPPVDRGGHRHLDVVRARRPNRLEVVSLDLSHEHKARVSRFKLEWAIHRRCLLLPVFRDDKYTWRLAIEFHQLLLGNQ